MITAFFPGLLKAAAYLDVLVFVALLLSVVGFSSNEQRWILKSLFGFALFVIVSFGVGFLVALGRYRGIGFTTGPILIISVLAIECGILGLMAFRMPFRY